MKINKLNTRILYLLGNNLHPKASSTEKIKSFLVNLFISFHLIFSTIIPTVRYISEHLDDTVNLLIAFYQLPGFLCSLFVFINFSFHKYRINEIFNEIESIVNEKMNLLKNGSYETSIESSDNFVKYLILFFMCSVTTISVTMLTFNIISSVLNGDIHTENWYLPFLFT